MVPASFTLFSIKYNISLKSFDITADAEEDMTTDMNRIDK